MGLVLAGCGGGGGGGTGPSAPVEKTVRSASYSFAVPSSWKVLRTTKSVTAVKGSSVVSVTVFRLLKRYRPSLWTKVVGELDRSAREHAGSTGRLLASQTVPVAARRTRSYSFSFSKGPTARIERLTLLLNGLREYQLDCLWPAKAPGEGKAACERFLATFTLR